MTHRCPHCHGTITASKRRIEHAIAVHLDSCPGKPLPAKAIP